MPVTPVYGDDSVENGEYDTIGLQYDTVYLRALKS